MHGNDSSDNMTIIGNVEAGAPSWPMCWCAPTDHLHCQEHKLSPDLHFDLQLVIPDFHFDSPLVIPIKPNLAKQPKPSQKSKLNNAIS